MSTGWFLRIQPILMFLFLIVFLTRWERTNVWGRSCFTSSSAYVPFSFNIRAPKKQNTLNCVTCYTSSVESMSDCVSIRERIVNCAQGENCLCTTTVKSVKMFSSALGCRCFVFKHVSNNRVCVLCTVYTRCTRCHRHIAYFYYFRGRILYFLKVTWLCRARRTTNGLRPREYSFACERVLVRVLDARWMNEFRNVTITITTTTRTRATTL